MADSLIQAGNAVAQNNSNPTVDNSQNNSGGAFSFMDGGTVGNNGAYTAPTVPKIPIPQKINSTILNSAPRVDVPTAPLSTPTPTMNYADRVIQASQVQDTPTQQIGDRLSTQIYDLIPKLAGESAALSEAQKAAGVDTFKQQLQDLNSQILTKQAEIGQSDTQLVASMRDAERRDTLLPFAQDSQAKLAGDAAILRALKTSEIGVLNARVLATQGNIKLAIETAKNAVDAKYAPYKEMISLYQAQLEALKPILTKEESRQADERKIRTYLALQQIADEKQQAKDNLALIFSSGLPNEYINKNGTLIRSSDAKSYSDPQEFFKDAGVSSFEEAYSKGLIGDLTADVIQNRDFALKAREVYGDARILPTDSSEQVAIKIANSAKWKHDSYIEGVGGMKIQKIDGVDYILENGQYVPASSKVAGGNQLQKDATEKAKELRDKLQNLLDDKNLGAAVGPISNKMPTLRGGTSDFENKFKNIQSLMTLDNLKLLKGSMSDKDIAFLQSAGTALNLNMSEKGFKDEVTNLIKKFDEKINNPNPSTASGYSWTDPTTGESWQFSDQETYNKFLRESGLSTGPSFNSAGNASASNQVKGIKEFAQKLPLLNMDGSEKTPNIPLTKAYPQGSYPTGKPNALRNQCGYFVRDLLTKQGLAYPTVGDTLSSKTSAVKKYGTKTGSVGSVLLTNESKTNGHVAYVIGQNAKGWVLAESNFKLDGKINYGRVIPYNSKNIIGFIQPKKA